MGAPREPSVTQGSPVNSGKSGPSRAYVSGQTRQRASEEKAWCSSYLAQGLWKPAFDFSSITAIVPEGHAGSAGWGSARPRSGLHRPGAPEVGSAALALRGTAHVITKTVCGGSAPRPLIAVTGPVEQEAKRWFLVFAFPNAW